MSEQAKVIQTLLGDHQDSVVSREHLIQQAEAAHAASEDTFTYGLLFQREADLAESAVSNSMRRCANSPRPCARHGTRQRKPEAGELACKPDSVIWAFVPFSCVGGVVTVQVRVLVVLANESDCQLYCGRPADGCRYRGHPSPRGDVRRDWGYGAKVGFWVSLAVGADSPAAGPHRSGCTAADRCRTCS